MPTGWEVVIGLETHTQLSTASKIFSGSSIAFGAEPNTQASAIDLALPGTLPVLNKAAVECAIKFGLAVNGGDDRHIAPRSVFARKNYFYPDLPKGYQISQFELPVVTGGSVTINVDGVEKVIRLTRAHLEEDAGKSVHGYVAEGYVEDGYAEEPAHGQSGIDLNRAGVPLLEIVSEPDMRSAEEAVAYAKALHGIVTWIGICDGNMQEGSFRCDANVSVRKFGDEKLGTRAEIKNVNSFRFLEKAINYEIRRQIELIEDGGKVVQETRLYDAERDETRSMRSKEDAMDYRYFPDPDLLPVEISRDWVEEVCAAMPELPETAAARLVAEDGITIVEARLITQSQAFVRYYENLREYSGSAKRSARWMLGEISAFLNREQLEIDDPEVPSESVVGTIIASEAAQEISKTVAREQFQALCDKTEADIQALTKIIEKHELRQAWIRYIESKGLKQVSNAGAIEKMIDDVIAANPKSVEEYKAGKEKALNALFGQVMKASNKTANPAQVTEILKRKLAS
ncbi:MAG: Asp-tRNA(Asn)/Glu-tRNA(Gln) amidotransferase subunit GatB [Betaproteobacteria bacterium]|nr:Asp-tRNA(Asn)/Glu-tRNA(Gln) amidotransferase subunit GatB [Betaproteobacteria bacterium]